MAKMKVQFPVEDKEIRTWNGKRVCDVIMKADNGLSYTLFSFEGDAAWSAKPGDELEVEVKEEATVSTRGKVRLPGGNKSGGNWKPRPFTIPDNETAGKAAEYACNLFKAVKGRLPEISDEAAARISSAIFNRTT